MIFPGRLEATPMNDLNGDAPRRLVCRRCAAELLPGSGDFYVVRVEAMADPTPPHFTAEDLAHDTAAEITRLLASMRQLSAEEALNQVYREMVFHLCGTCYRQWIDNPLGLP